jgi:aminoglycoside phosphotransferase (APT) family kinase protein
MLVRLPSAAEYALAVDKEHRWLAALAPQLPLPIPVPLAKGEPGAGYPYPWSVYPWLDGEPASADRIADPVRFAADLAGFLAALRSVDSSDGPRPGKHNWFRGGTLRTYDREVQMALRHWTDTLMSTWRARSGRPPLTHAGTVWRTGSTVTLLREISCSTTGS